MNIFKKNTTIAVITTVHDPNDTRIYHRQIASLVKHGFNIIYCCKEIPKTELGVKIILLQQFGNKILRILLSPLGAFFTALKLKEAQVFHLHDPELIITGLLLKLFGKKVVFDLHEDVPSQILTKNWIAPFLRRFVSRLYSRLESFSLKWFDLVITVTQPIVDRLKANGIQKISMVRNFPIKNELVSSEWKAMATRNYDAVDLGEASVPRGLKIMVEAVLESEKIQSLLIMGRLNPEDFLQNYKTHKNFSRINYVGTKNRKEVAQLLNDSKIGIVPLPGNPNNLVGYPTKLFEYMSCSLPVIASDLPLIKEINDVAHCALLYSSESSLELKKRLDELIDDADLLDELGKNGRLAIDSVYSWEAEEKQLFELYESLLILENK